MKEWWEDFRSFRRFITPTVMPVVFWVGVALAVIFGILNLVEGARGGNARLIIHGVFVLFAGPVFVRILCELVIKLFQRG